MWKNHIFSIDVTKIDLKIVKIIFCSLSMCFLNLFFLKFTYVKYPLSNVEKSISQLSFKLSNFTIVVNFILCVNGVMGQ